MLINFFDDIARLQSAVRIFINFCDDDPVNAIWNIQLTGDFRSQFANLNGIKWTSLQFAWSSGTCGFCGWGCCCRGATRAVG